MVEPGRLEAFRARRLPRPRLGQQLRRLGPLPCHPQVRRISRRLGPHAFRQRRRRPVRQRRLPPRLPVHAIGEVAHDGRAAAHGLPVVLVGPGERGVEVVDPVAVAPARRCLLEGVPQRGRDGIVTGLDVGGELDEEHADGFLAERDLEGREPGRRVRGSEGEPGTLSGGLRRGQLGRDGL
ncbi:hypothetical protein DFJ74DRAFT_657083 [Hyaloraphidium curvatum]|nr:hypothetical protein DFJ74DRAFT_657083 [Hyaloraphidium curvatum]